MASPPFNPDETVPADDAIAANFPPLYRQTIDILESWLLVEHDRHGHHKIMADTTTNRDSGTWENGGLFYNTSVNALQFRKSGSWDTITIPTGTVAVFNQTNAPVGWTKLTNVNNAALRVVSGTAGSGGTRDFTAAFTSHTVTGTVGNTTLTINQIPSHSHSLSRVSGVALVGPGSTSLALGTSGSGATTTSTGGGQPHNHSFTGGTLNLAVRYVDVIRAQKD